MTNSHQPHQPNEAILLSTPLGLDELGSDFNPHAPFTACRLCGALWQTAADRYSYEINEEAAHYPGDVVSAALRTKALAISKQQTRLRHESLANHERVCHTTEEIELLSKMGWAMMPEAAHKLAPFGIAPTGNLHDEIVDAMATAPRAPLISERS